MTKSSIILIRNASRTDFGGGERVPVFVAQEARRAGLTSIVFSRSEKLLNFAKSVGVTHKKSWWWQKQNWSGKQAILLPFYLLWQLILLLYYIGQFKLYRAGVVHVQSKDDFIAATFAAKLCSASVIWSDHADLKHIFMNHRIWYKNPVGKLVYIAAHFAQKITVVSKEDLRLISEHIPEGPVRQKMVIVYNGAFDTFTETTKNNTFTFVSTGRLVTDKGIGELIDAFNVFSKSHSDSQLLLLGDGPERKKFEDKAGTNKAIRFLGYQQDPLDYVTKSHIFLLPTYHEGFSLALVEACMLQMPIIATNVGGNPEIIQDGKTGLLVAAKDSNSLLNAMEKLYANKKLREQLAKNARLEYEKSFDFKKIINDNFLSYYRKHL